MESHLLQMRGLKPTLPDYTLRDIYVASFTDAWIETTHRQHCQHRQKSHLLQMRGLKLVTSNCSITSHRSHLLQMRGLKLQDVAI